MLAEHTSASEDEILSRKRKIKKNKRILSDSSSDSSSCEVNNIDSKDSHSSNFNNYFNDENNLSTESIVQVDIAEEDSQSMLDNSQPIDTNDFLELNIHTEFPETYRDFGKIKPGTKFKIT